MTAIASILDSTYFRAFFALWTGFYIWQIAVGEEGPGKTAVMWIFIGLVSGVLILGSKGASSATS